MERRTPLNHGQPASPATGRGRVAGALTLPAIPGPIAVVATYGLYHGAAMRNAWRVQVGEPEGV